MDVCRHCGDHEIRQHVSVVELGDAWQIGLAYKENLVRGTEMLFCDLCTHCGTITRWYVDHADRDWITK